MFKSQRKRVWCWSKQNYCITVSMQKAAQFIHSFIWFWSGWVWSDFQVGVIKNGQGHLVHETKWPCPFLITPTWKSDKQLLAFLNLHQHAKNQSIPYIHWDMVNFRVLWPNLLHPFLTMPTLPTVFHWLDLAENFLAQISETKMFSKWILCRNKANNITFVYSTNSVKINDKSQ